MSDSQPRLPPNQQLIRTERWPVVGESQPRANDESEWTVTISRNGASVRRFTLDELQSFGTTARTLDIHCVTRWSKFDMTFGGVPLERILAMGQVDAAARFVSFVARSDRNHSTSLPLEVAIRLNCLLAFSSNGQPLASEHGGPVRMVVPGRYFYKSVKWLERIDILDEDRLGYWEADAGYHNVADPWEEQRYVAGSLTKQQAASIITSRDFSGLDLLGLSVANHDLSGLIARDALLRNADFQGATLTNADFMDSNLSNARFATANLTGACFTGADLDGADLSGADLRSADLRCGSMFGTSFAVIDEAGVVSQPAIFDSTTQLDLNLLDALTADQRQFVLSRL